MSDIAHKNHQPQNERTVLVFGATGKQGGAVATSLKASGWAVRAFVRTTDGEPARRLASKGIGLHLGDFSDVNTIRTAMVGVHGVFSVQPNSGSPGSGVTDADEVRIGKTIADIAIESGVQHLVYTSAGIISRGRTGLANLDTKIDIENHIRSLDITSTIIRPATFMDLFTLPGMGLSMGLFSFFVHPQQAFQAIAVEDIGRIVSAVFENMQRYADRVIEIAGDELTGQQLAEALTQAAGRPIAYQRFPAALLEENEFLRRNAELFSAGRGSANADISALKQEFGELTRVSQWLSGPGVMALKAALSASDGP